MSKEFVSFILLHNVTSEHWISFLSRIARFICCTAHCNQIGEKSWPLILAYNLLLHLSPCVLCRNVVKHVNKLKHERMNRKKMGQMLFQTTWVNRTFRFYEMCGEIWSENEPAKRRNYVLPINVGSYACMTYDVRSFSFSRAQMAIAIDTCLRFFPSFLFHFTLYYFMAHVNGSKIPSAYSARLQITLSPRFVKKVNTFSVIIVVPIAWDIGLSLDLSNKLVDNQRIHFTTIFLGLFSPFASTLYYYYFSTTYYWRTRVFGSGSLNFPSRTFLSLWIVWVATNSCVTRLQS